MTSLYLSLHLAEKTLGDQCTTCSGLSDGYWTNILTAKRFIYPIHMNPVVREAAKAELGDCDQIHIIVPIEVFDCHNFEARSYLCLTDSGDIQAECPSYGVPVLMMRDTTERPEEVDAGTLRLVGTDEEEIYKAFTELLDDPEVYEAMSVACNPYGDGHACERIADILEGKEYDEWVAE